MMKRLFLSASRLLVLVLAATTAAWADPLLEAIRVRSEALRQGRTLEIGGARVSSSVVLPEFYEGALGGTRGH
ncbi:MAG: hypothetical protein HZB55_11380 [Deltaproteobacteria bacterium]|nr:hypothetical protein [Deltaproteobacteria bacterium]